MLVGVGPPKETGTQQGGKLQDRELRKVLNLQKESTGYLKLIHLEKVQHCTDLSLQVTLPAHTQQGKIELGLTRVRVNVAAHQEKKENEKTCKREAKKKRENS